MSYTNVSAFMVSCKRYSLFENLMDFFEIKLKLYIIKNKEEILCLTQFQLINKV